MINHIPLGAFRSLTSQDKLQCLPLLCKKDVAFLANILKYSPERKVINEWIGKNRSLVPKTTYKKRMYFGIADIEILRTFYLYKSLTTKETRRRRPVLWNGHWMLEEVIVKDSILSWVKFLGLLFGSFFMLYVIALVFLSLA